MASDLMKAIQMKKGNMGRKVNYDEDSDWSDD